MDTEHENEPHDGDQNRAPDPHVTFYGDRVLDEDNDHVEDFIEHAFAVEVIKSSLRELELHPSHTFDGHRRFLMEHALAYSEHVFEFVVRESRHWGLLEGEIWDGLGRRWRGYVDFMTPMGSAPEAGDRRKFLEAWIRSQSAAYNRPTWLDS